MSDFQLIPDPKAPWWIDVKYVDEQRPRYMINTLNLSCTCMGGTFAKGCKHIQKYLKEKNRK